MQRNVYMQRNSSAGKILQLQFGLKNWDNSLMVLTCILFSRVLQNSVFFANKATKNVIYDTLILVVLFPSDQQVDFLLKRRHMYLLPGGCLNISAINGSNFEYVIESIHLALTTPLWPRGLPTGPEIRGDLRLLWKPLTFSSELLSFSCTSV